MGWAQVDRFYAEVRKYQEATGKTQAQVAKDLGTTYGTLRFWLSGTRPPKVENMKKAASLFKCQVADFIEDSPAPDDITPEEWASEETARTMASAVFLHAKQYSPADQKKFYQAYKHWRESLEIGPKSVKKGKKKA